jgi:mannosyl-3-phosphoglycerate synthase
MRLEHPRLTERFGAVRIHELQRVIELDSGSDRVEGAGEHLLTSQIISSAAIRGIERELAIVIPCMN